MCLISKLIIAWIVRQGYRFGLQPSVLQKKKGYPISSQAEAPVTINNVLA